MNLFTVTLPDSAAGLLTTYGAGALIRVQSSPTTGGIYGDVTTIPIVTGVTTYPVYDVTGSSTDWYEIRYESANGTTSGTYSAAFQPMPSAGIYASLADFNTFTRDTDPADDALKLLALEAASRAIDRATNTTFTSPVPMTITNACLLQASRFFKRRDAPFGIAGSPDLGSEMRLLAALDPDVKVMVGLYRVWWVAV